MKYLILLVIIFFQSIAFSKRIENYQYPFTKPYMATVLSAISGSTVPYFSYKEIFIGDYKNRSNRNISTAGLLLHEGERRPLVFVLGGFGASIQEGSVRLLAYNLHTKMGFHVIAMPDQFFWYFALTTDKNVALGDFPADIKSYGLIMRKTLAKAQSMGLKFSDISIAGYSIGGMKSLFLAKQDKQDGFFNFKTVVAIDPSMSVLQSARLIDKAHNNWKQYTKRQKEILMQRGLSLHFKVTEKVANKNKNLLEFILKNFPYTEEQAQSFIGYQFLTKLVSYLKVSEFVNKTGLFKDTKELVSFGLFNYKTTFLQYYKRFLHPFYVKKEPNLSLKEFAYRSSLYSLKDFLSSSSNIFIQHNQDDVLLLNPEKSLNFLESTLNDRVLIYPTGGHLGNLWFPTNIKHFLNFFSR